MAICILILILQWMDGNKVQVFLVDEIIPILSQSF